MSLLPSPAVSSPPAKRGQSVAVQPQWSALRINLAPSQGFVRHAKASFIPRVWFKKRLTDFDYWFIHSGEAELIDELGVRRPLRRGVVCVLRPHSVWQVEPVSPSSEPLSMSWFHFDIVDAVRGQPLPTEALAGVPNICQCHEPEFTETTCRRILQLGFLWQETGRCSGAYDLAGEMLKMLMREIVVDNFQENGPAVADIDPDRYRRLSFIVAELRRDFRTFPTVEHMARHCNVSVDYFTRLFKRVFSKTPLDTLLEAKIEMAKRLLVGTNDSISQIAEKMDYSNVHFFSRQFKAKVGRSPLAYRRNRQKGAPLAEG